jgi:hypothetical protein
MHCTSVCATAFAEVCVEVLHVVGRIIRRSTRLYETKYSQHCREMLIAGQQQSQQHYKAITDGAAIHKFSLAQQTRGTLLDSMLLHFSLYLELLITSTLIARICSATLYLYFGISYKLRACFCTLSLAAAVNTLCV